MQTRLYKLTKFFFSVKCHITTRTILFNIKRDLSHFFRQDLVLEKIKPSPKPLTIVELESAPSWIYRLWTGPIFLLTYSLNPVTSVEVLLTSHVTLTAELFRGVTSRRGAGVTVIERMKNCTVKKDNDGCGHFYTILTSFRWRAEIYIKM